MSNLPPFPRGKIKIRRVYPRADGTIELPATSAPDEWWDAVLEDPKASGKPKDYDTLWFNRDDTADLSCSDCHLTREVRIASLLADGRSPDAKVSDAIADLVKCQRSAKRCRLGYKLRSKRR